MIGNMKPVKNMNDSQAKQAKEVFSILKKDVTLKGRLK